MTPGEHVKPTHKLHHEGQSLWLDNITRDLLTSGTLQRYIDELGITGLTSNPTIFDQAFLNTPAYDEAIRQAAASRLSGEDIFFTIAIDDLRAAADLFRPTWERTHGLDGWVSLEVSPLLAYDAESTLQAAIDLHGRADRANLFIKIPGTAEGLQAIEDAIFAGVPVNVTLLFDRDHYLAAADAYMRGIERRVEAGLDPAVGSVASVFVSRWDTAHESTDRPDELHNRLGIAMAKRTYAAYREVLESDRWERLANEGALPQRLLWASTGTKDPHASDVLYVRSLAAPLTVNTMPEKTLLAFGDHGEVGELLSRNGADGEATIERFVAAGVDIDALAQRLQVEAAEAFERSWDELLENIHAKSATLIAAG
jgi:transaldolase